MADEDPWYELIVNLKPFELSDKDHFHRNDVRNMNKLVDALHGYSRLSRKLYFEVTSEMNYNIYGCNQHIDLIERFREVLSETLRDSSGLRDDWP